MSAFIRALDLARRPRPCFGEDVPEVSWVPIIPPHGRYRMGRTDDGAEAITYLVPFTNGRNYYGCWWTMDFAEELEMSGGSAFPIIRNSSNVRMIPANILGYPHDRRVREPISSGVYGVAMFAVFSYRDSWPLAAVCGQIRTPIYRVDHAWRYLPRVVFLNRTKYSVTTSKHDRITRYGIDRLSEFSNLFTQCELPYVEVEQDWLRQYVWHGSGGRWFMTGLDMLEVDRGNKFLCNDLRIHY